MKDVKYCPLTNKKCMPDCQWWDKKNKACFIVSALKKFMDKTK